MVISERVNRDINYNENNHENDFVMITHSYLHDEQWFCVVCCNHHYYMCCNCQELAVSWILTSRQQCMVTSGRITHNSSTPFPNTNNSKNQAHSSGQEIYIK